MSPEGLVGCSCAKRLCPHRSMDNVKGGVRSREKTALGFPATEVRDRSVGGDI